MKSVLEKERKNKTHQEEDNPVKSLQKFNYYPLVHPLQLIWTSVAYKFLLLSFNYVSSISNI